MLLMKRNLYLLPHGCRRIGVGMLLAIPVVLLAYFVIFHFMDFDLPGHLETGRLINKCTNTVASALLLGGIVLVVFSCEKSEDEMIDAIRRSSVVTVAYVFFLLFMAVNLFCLFFPRYYFDPQEHRSLTAGFWTTAAHPFLFFLYYEAVFRFRLAKLKRELRHEE